MNESARRATTPGRRPGRPVRLPEDGPTPAASDSLSDSVRLAWLLVVSRLMNADPALVSRARFVDRLRGHGVAADTSRVSRWEGGQQPLPARLVATYERLLEMPEWSLVTLARGLRRHAGHAPGRLGVSVASSAARWPAADPAVELEARLGAALATDGPDLTGVDWLSLVDHVTAFDAIYLGRRDWSTLCLRLLGDCSRATGTAERLRWEAAATLMGHPVAGPHLVEAVADWVDTPHAQRVVPAVLLLAESGTDAGHTLWQRLLSATTTTATARDAAATVAATRLSRGLLDQSTTQRLEHYVASQLTGSDARPSVPSLDLATQLPRAALSRTIDGVADPGLRRRLQEVAEDRLVLPRAVTSRVSRSVVRSVRAAVSGPVDLVPDPLLERLVTESLFHVGVHRRWLASTVIGLSPYGPALVEAYLDLACGSDPAVAANAWRAVLAIGDDNPSPRLAMLALSEDRRGMQSVALNALSRSSSELDDDQRDVVVATACTAETVSARLGAVSVLARSAPSRLDRFDGVSEQVDGAARWWQALGPRIQGR